MSIRTTTIESLSTVTVPTALSSKNFILLSKIDTYIGSSDPAYQIYKVSENVLLHGYKPTIVDVARLTGVIEEISADYRELSSKMQDRGSVETQTGMMDKISGYMLIREVANDMGKMIHEEDVADLTDKFVEESEVSAVESELYARGEELAHEAMDYAGAINMALITAHAPVDANEEEEEDDEKDNNQD